MLPDILGSSGPERQSCQHLPSRPSLTCQIIIGDTFSSLASQYLSPGMYTDRHAILLVVAVVFILPMCFARSLAALGEPAPSARKTAVRFEPLVHKHWLLDPAPALSMPKPALLSILTCAVPASQRRVGECRRSGGLPVHQLGDRVARLPGGDVAAATLADHHAVAAKSAGGAVCHQHSGVWLQLVSQHNFHLLRGGARHKHAANVCSAAFGLPIAQ